MHETHPGVWALAARQHGVVSRAQLLALGFSRRAIAHRMGRRRLNPVWRGVFAVGRPDLTREGLWLAAVLACGPDAVLSHASAAALWGLRGTGSGDIEVSVPACRRACRPGIVVHRRKALRPEDITRHHGIPVTTPACTVIDLAGRLLTDELERTISEADRLDLIDPEALRRALDDSDPRPGVGRLRRTLDRRTFALTDSELERRFLTIARAAGLPPPLTRRLVNGFRVDFYWPELGLVVETDGLRYHRTPQQQARDRVRDQVHVAAGLTCLRFTHAQVVKEPQYVRATLRAVARRVAPDPQRRSSRYQVRGTFLIGPEGAGPLSG